MGKIKAEMYKWQEYWEHVTTKRGYFYRRRAKALEDGIIVEERLIWFY